MSLQWERWAAVAALSLGVVLNAMAAESRIAPSAAAPTRHKDADVVLMSATRLRALALETPTLIASELDRMPQGIFERTHKARAARTQVWSLFFTGTVLKAGGLTGDHAVTIFLNPLADVAVLQYCDRESTGELACETTCAITGERLAPVRKDKPMRAPVWTQAADPVEGLTKTARSRLASFAERYPINPKGEPPEVLCTSKEQVAAELRLRDLVEAVSRVRPAALAAALKCATTGEPNCESRIIADPKLRERVVDLVRSKGAVAVAGVIHTKDHMNILLVPKLSAWQFAVIRVQEDSPDKYAFNSLTYFAL